MKPLLVFLALTFTASLHAQHLKLSADSKGVVVDGGPAGRLVLSGPVIVGSDKKGRKPTFLPAEDGASATATYADGFVIKVDFSAVDGTIAYSFAQIPADALLMKITAALPLSYNQGGTYALNNDGASKPFPGEPGNQIIAQGASSQFNLTTGTGEGLSFTVPAAYHQLSDARAWGAQGFSWTYFYDLKRYSNETRFTIQVALIKK